MKLASVYTGRSMSQPVLYNELSRLSEEEISLEVFGDGRDEPEIHPEHEHHLKTTKDVKLFGKKLLWASQYRLRKQWAPFLKDKVNKSFDLVIGMNELGAPTVRVANEHNIPSLFFVRNLESSGQEMYRSDRTHLRNFVTSDLGGKVQYPFLVNNFREYKRGLEGATAVVANSEYVQKRLKQDFGVDSEVVYPPIRLEEYKVEYDRDGYIGMVNPRNTEKGGDIFMDIVESMPKEDFLSVGVFRNSSLEDRAESLDNLDHIGWCSDMSDFYKQVKLIVVPSRWNEAFGRVAAEAMVSGIPCVVSDRGGLPEVVGDTAEIIKNIESTKAWKNGIKDALNDHDPEQQMLRSEKFSAQKQGEKLNEIVKSVI